MFDKKNNCSDEFNERLRKRFAESDADLFSVWDPETQAEVSEHPGGGLSGEALAQAMKEELEFGERVALAMKDEPEEAKL